MTQYKDDSVLRNGHMQFQPYMEKNRFYLLAKSETSCKKQSFIFLSSLKRASYCCFAFFSEIESTKNSVLHRDGLIVTYSFGLIRTLFQSNILGFSCYCYVKYVQY